MSERQPSIWNGLKWAVLYCAAVLALSGGAVWLYPRMGRFGAWFWSVF